MVGRSRRSRFHAGIPQWGVAGQRPIGISGRKSAPLRGLNDGYPSGGRKRAGPRCSYRLWSGRSRPPHRARRPAIAAADVLVVDRLVGAGVLDHARADAVIISVGKEAGGPSTSQDEINRILVREALKGQRVARLKGGDGFVFGRAAEEMALCARRASALTSYLASRQRMRVPRVLRCRSLCARACAVFTRHRRDR